MKKYILLQEIVEKTDPHMVSCMQCGSCNSVCHATSPKNGMGPEKLIRMILLGHDEDALNSSWVWRCSLCGRCAQHCPMNIDIPGIMYFLRKCQKKHLAPYEIRDFLHRTLTSGNVLSLTPFEVIKTLNWIETELRRSSGCNQHYIPIDAEGAELLVFVSSRDLKFNPRTILSLAHTLNIAKTNWTIPSYGFEESNFGAMLGDTDGENIITMQKIQTMKNLGASGMLMDSCEHAFTRPEMGPRPLRQTEPDFWVTSTPTLIWSLMERGLISPPKRPVNAHLVEEVVISDPCGTTRDSSPYKAVRAIFKWLGLKVHSLEPSPPNAICCGGGAGTSLLPLKSRMELTYAKAQQLKELTPGSVVTTYCRQCAEILREIIHTHHIGIQFIGIHELLYEFLACHD